MRGRRPKPSALKNPRISHRRGNDREPQPRPGAVCPAWLDAIAKEEWSRVAGELQRLGLLTKLDQTALSVYCTCYSRWLEAERFLAANGTVIMLRDDKGVLKSVIPAPQVNIAFKCMDKIRAFAGEFGCSPSSRGRLELPQTDPLEDLTPEKREEYLAEIESRIAQLESTEETESEVVQ